MDRLKQKPPPVRDEGYSPWYHPDCGKLRHRLGPLYRGETLFPTWFQGQYRAIFARQASSVLFGVLQTSLVKLSAAGLTSLADNLLLPVYKYVGTSKRKCRCVWTQ